MSSKTTEAAGYNPVEPIRTFHAKIQIVNAGPMPPMKVELPMTESTEMRPALRFARAETLSTRKCRLSEWRMAWNHAHRGLGFVPIAEDTPLEELERLYDEAQGCNR